MKNRDTHIISTVRWNTSFNSKIDAAVLQEKLSAWSRLYMSGLISKVFDSICPPDQTWIINQLEIDLGLTDYNDLEDMLTQKVTRKLRKKMMEITFNSGNNNSNTGFKIIERSA